MPKTISWAWPLAGLIACGGEGGSQTSDTDVTSGPAEGTADDDSSGGPPGTTQTLGDTSDSSPETSNPGDGSSGESDDGPGTTGTADGTASESGSSEGGSRCGDDSCDADEDEGSCCVDCGCAEGSSCVDAACTPDPFCGDAACNGSETQADCCDDCGCAEGSACQEGACVVLPYCGDGSCNGAETIDDCCDDCGCGENYTCEANACSCTGAYIHFENVMPDMNQYCFATSSFYTQESVAYLNDGMQWIYMPDAGFADYPEPLGGSLDGTLQCCLLDVCGGTMTCPTPGGNYPCFCADPTPVSGSADVCGENFVGLCG